MGYTSRSVVCCLFGEFLSVLLAGINRQARMKSHPSAFARQLLQVMLTASPEVSREQAVLEVKSIKGIVVE
jgi:hypothetical protein